MLDIKYIRENAEEVKQNCINRRVDVNIDRILELDQERRDFMQQVEELRAERNKKSKGKPSDEDILHMREVGDKIKHFEERLTEIEEEYNELLLCVPNITFPDTPVGMDESENKVVKEYGEKTTFDFKPKEHWEIGQERDLINLEKAAEISGSRFAYIKGGLVQLEFALIQYVLSVVTEEKTLKEIAKNADINISTKPFLPILPPVMMRPEVMQKMGRLEPRDERYHLEKDDLYLVGSAEHTLGPLHMDEIIAEEILPIRYLGFSTAFRREAGSYGKDTKGIFRVHQFDKLEFESFTTAEQGQTEQDFIMAIQEHLVQGLEIPYRIVQKCTGDMGAPDYREFDIEAWLPGQNKYRETHTSDYMTDYQSRRLNTKVKIQNENTEYVHMNDATVFAIGRTLIALMENHQQEDGSIKIPKALQTYMGKERI